MTCIFLVDHWVLCMEDKENKCRCQHFLGVFEEYISEVVSEGITRKSRIDGQSAFQRTALAADNYRVLET